MKDTETTNNSEQGCFPDDYAGNNEWEEIINNRECPFDVFEADDLRELNG